MKLNNDAPTKEQEGPRREDQVITKASCHVTHPHVHQVTDRALERGEGLSAAKCDIVDGGAQI